MPTCEPSAATRVVCNVAHVMSYRHVLMRRLPHDAQEVRRTHPRDDERKVLGLQRIINTFEHY